MNRVLCFLYGLVCYAIFFATFLYVIGFVGNVSMLPKTIDSGTAGSIGTAILINALLLGVFAIQHAVMARPGFKARWTKLVPEPIERSTFVLATCICLALLVWQWRPMTGTIWQVDSEIGRIVLVGLFALGWAIVLYTTFLIDHFDLFGLRQVFLHLRGREYTPVPFMERSLYKWVRQPMMIGFIIASWSTPVMTAGHLLFAIGITGYIFIGTFMEERDLVAGLGEDYRSYRRRTPMFLPRPWKSRPATTEAAA